MDKIKIYNSYNEIKCQKDIVIVTTNQLKELEAKGKDPKFLVAINKSHTNNPERTISLKDIYDMVNKINHRLDNLENYVLEQFKKHGWTE